MAGVEACGPLGEHGSAGQQAEIATLVFNDGSKYTGTLKNGTPHGLGTCVWKDGNQYDGEWRNGVMHGFGTYLWTSGQRYDGEWKDGKREGVGVKMYADGSTFHGIWRDGKKHGVGVFKPALKDKDRGRALVKTSSGRLMAAPPLDGESLSNLRAYESAQHTQQQPETPMQADANSKESTHGGFDALAGAPAASDSVMEKRDKEKELEREGKLVFIRVFDDGVLRREEKLSSEDAKMIFGQQPQSTEDRGRKARKKVKRALGLGKKLQQKHGQLLYKGMPGYDLMLRLQHGIRWSIGRGSHGLSTEQQQQLQASQMRTSSIGGAPMTLSHSLVPSDFTQKVKVFFPSAGTSITPAHPAGDFKWKDYSPRVFRNLRNMYGIADADYMLSLGGSSALWQLNSPGKSGCMFFLSDDERFLVKTMRKTEIRTLLDLLPKYYSYMESQPQNLVIRFFGVHGVKQVHGRTVRFVVMHNMFNTDLQIHKKFDLKGSTEGRTTGPQVVPSDPKTVFKDLDLDLQFLVEPAVYAALIRQIHSDAEFLRTVEVMDYSLLLGIHFCNRARLAQEDPSGPQPNTEATPPGAQRVSSGGGGPAPGAGGGLQVYEAHGSSDVDDPTQGQRVSPARNGLPHSPGAHPGGRMDDLDGDHVRNFDLFSDKQDLDKQLRLFEERMRGLGYSEQRMGDILSLARLRILGDRLKKRSKKAHKVYDGPATVLKALASRRHGADSLPRLEEGEEPGAVSDDEVEEPGPVGKQPPYLGYQMRALAVHTNGEQPPEEVVLCFGVIDILQEWNARKVFERTFKSMTHDSYAISVAPPKLYSLRFADFLTKNVFMDPAVAAAKGLHLPPANASLYGPYSMGVQTIEEERDSDYHPSRHT